MAGECRRENVPAHRAKVIYDAVYILVSQKRHIDADAYPSVTCIQLRSAVETRAFIHYMDS